jgi:phospholipid/cholesterol/gamma-HCH transport system substrate-binding protein
LKISREIKTAILVITSLLLFIWGYSFLKGSDLLSSYKKLNIIYDNVEGLGVGAPVTINGLTVGKVNKIDLKHETGKLWVEIQVNEDIPVSKSSLAEMYAPSALGGKQIAIVQNLNDKTQTVSGDFLKSNEKLGMIDNIAGQIPGVKEKLDLVLTNANATLLNINQLLDGNTKSNLQASLANLNLTLIEFKKASVSINGMLADNKTKINGIVQNFGEVSKDFSTVSDSLTKLRLGKTVAKLDHTLASVNKMMNDLNAGRGTMGKVLKDEALYTNINKTAKQIELLMQDLRLNPTRYVNVSLFGKKNKPYTAPDSTNTRNK